MLAHIARCSSVLVVLGLSLAGCGACDDACHADRARSHMSTDLGAVAAEIDAIGDPVLRTAVLMDAMQRPGVVPTPPQAAALCATAPNQSTRTHCENRFLRPHLNQGRQ